MKLTHQTINQKGQTNMYYVVVGIVITLGVLFAVKYFHDRDNDIVIHPPHIEVNK